MQEQQRLLEKFGPSPFSDKADCLLLLDQFRESEARMVQARGGLYYTPGLGRYADDSEPSTDGATPASMDDDQCSLNYARKAIRQLTAIGKGERRDIQFADPDSDL